MNGFYDQSSLGRNEIEDANRAAYSEAYDEGRATPPEAFDRNQIVVRAEQTLSPMVRFAAWVPVSKAMLDDTVFVGNFLDQSSSVWDRSLRPWLFADTRGWPAAFDLFPHAHRLGRRAQRTWDEASSRLRIAWRVLRTGDPSVDDEDDW